MTDYIGKEVKIISNFGGHFFQKGDVVRILEMDVYDEDYGQGYKAEYLDGHDFWYIYEQEGVRSEFDLIGESKMINYEVGQILEVYNNTCGHNFEIGEKVRVRTLDKDGNVDSCEHLDCHDFWYLDDDDVRHIQGELQ